MANSKQLLEDFKMTICSLTVFFIPYAVLEIPSNIILKQMRPSVWIGSLVLAFGLVMTLMGLVQNFGGLVGARAAVSNHVLIGDYIY